MSPSPPRLPLRLLSRVLRNDPAGRAILGDLQEDFVGLISSRGPGAARRWYWRQAISLAVGRLIQGMLSAIGRRPMNDSPSLGSLLQDVVYAARAVRRAPGFALFAALIIGLGVGATTSVFSVLRPLLLAPLPFERPQELVWIANEGDAGNNSLSAVTSRSGNLRDFRTEARSFEGLTGYNAFFDQDAYTLTGVGEPERLAGVGVAHDFLDVLGVDLVLGRSFTEVEGAWGGPGAVILTHGFWWRRFAGDPQVMGRTLELNGEPRTVVGVLPPTFDFSSIFAPGVPADFLVPFPVSDETDQRGNTMVMVGRLRSGTTPESAQQELDAVVTALQEVEPDRWGLAARVTPLQEHVAGPFRGALLLLAGAAATVLLIVSVNVSGLMLARSPRRSREVAVRKAMGASRSRLLRQLLLESFGVSLLGGALGATLAWAMTGAVSRTAAARIPMMDQVGVDAGALLFGIGVAVITGLVVGLVPALHVTDGDEAGVLRASGRGSTSGRGVTRLREVLVIGEVALACGLLVVGGLLLRSFNAVLDVDLGFQADHAVAWQLNPSRAFESNAEVATFFGTLADRVAQVSGVQEVGLIDALPLGRSRSWGFSIPGRPESEDGGLGLYPHLVSPGYLAAMGIRLEAGRNLDRSDTRESAPVVMINEAGARRLFPGQEALGRFIQLWDERQWEIVGIVHDVHHLSPETDPGIQVYFPLTQMGDHQTLDLVVRSTRPSDEMATAVSAALAEIDPAMPTREHWTVLSTVDRAVAARRFTLGILSGFGLAALLLAALGIYGVLAQSVAERTPEIGIRMALGASAGDVVGNVIGRTLLLTAVGVALGTGLAFWGGRLVRSLLFGVEATDPLTLLVMAALLFAVALVAATVPALRAARTQGARALRVG